MGAIYKREVKAYFTSILGYIVIGLLLLLTGVFFWGSNLYSKSPDVGQMLYTISTFDIIILPLLTMRVFAEEQKQKTDQLLFAAPVTLWDVVLGKYLAVVTVFSATFLVTCTMPIVLSQYGNVSFITNYAAILAYWMLGCVLLAVGVLVSAMTDNQIVAGFINMGLNFAIWLMGSIASILPSTANASMIGILVLLLLVVLFLFFFTRNVIVSAGTFLAGTIAVVVVYLAKKSLLNSVIVSVLSSVSYYARFQNVVGGTFEVATVVYYVSSVVLFLYITMQLLQKRRWN